MIYDPELIVSLDNRKEIVDFLIDAGYSAAQIAIMGNVQLANAYHAVGQTGFKVTEQQRKGASIFLKLLEIFYGSKPIDIERVPHYMTEIVLKISMLRHNIMLVGPAGCGKTTIVEHCADVLNKAFYITSAINETHDLLGFVDGYGNYHRTAFREAFENGGVWLADELDAWEASALLTANAALANGICNFPDRSIPLKRHSDFQVIATANTFGTGADRVYVGRNELDAASLDRFATLEIDYDLNLERLFSNGNEKWLQYVWSIRKKVTDKRIRHVVSSRAISMGSAALNIGVEWDNVKEIYLFKGMSSRDREKIDDE